MVNLFGEELAAPAPPRPRKGEVQEYYLKREPAGPRDLAIRVCPFCHGELWWRYRVGVTWDRGLPVCEDHGLLHAWRVLSRDGKRLLAFARVDNKGRVLQQAVDLVAHAARPARTRNARHHYKGAALGTRRMFSIELHDVRRAGPATWAERLGPAQREEAE